LEYEVHQVGPKDFGSQNFSFLAFKGKAVGVTQIFPTTARDRRKKIRSNHQIFRSNQKLLKRENQQ
jgi:hypothetical protein